jgi:hypothetical protein
MVKTIGTGPLKDFVKYVIYTGFVTNCPYPTSGLIIAPPEHAKSTEVEKFECLGVIQIDKSTAYGLADIIRGLTKKELAIYHHFSILDLENYASSMREVKEQFLALVRQTGQEGIKRYHTAKIDLNLEERKDAL